jgi:hypothetical protein
MTVKPPAACLGACPGGHQVGLHHDADIGRPKVFVDDRAVADVTAEAKIAADQRRQPAHRVLGIERVGGQTIHGEIALGDRARPQFRRRQVKVAKIGERLVQLLRLHAGKARTPEHHVDIVVEDVLRDAAPQKLHDGAGSVVTVDARAPQFHDFSGMVQ